MTESGHHFNNNTSQTPLSRAVAIAGMNRFPHSLKRGVFYTSIGIGDIRGFARLSSVNSDFRATYDGSNTSLIRHAWERAQLDAPKPARHLRIAVASTRFWDHLKDPSTAIKSQVYEKPTESIPVEAWETEPLDTREIQAMLQLHGIMRFFHARNSHCNFDDFCKYIIYTNRCGVPGRFFETVEPYINWPPPERFRNKIITLPKDFDDDEDEYKEKETVFEVMLWLSHIVQKELHSGGWDKKAYLQLRKDAGLDESTQDVQFTEGALTWNLAIKFVRDHSLVETYEIMKTDSAQKEELLSKFLMGFFRDMVEDNVMLKDIRDAAEGSESEFLEWLEVHFAEDNDNVWIAEYEQRLSWMHPRGMEPDYWRR